MLIRLMLAFLIRPNTSISFLLVCETFCVRLEKQHLKISEQLPEQNQNTAWDICCMFYYMKIKQIDL